MSKLFYALLKIVTTVVVSCLVFLVGVAKVPVSQIASVHVYTDKQISEIKGDAYNDGYRRGIEFAKASYEEDQTYPEYYDNEYSEPYYQMEEDPIVYHTPEGECYHIDYNCHYIVGHQRISEEFSKARTHLRPCSDCAYATDFD